MNTPNEQYQYQLISATTQIKNAPGLIGGIFCSSVTGSPTLTVYDDVSGGTTTKIVDTFTLTAGTPFPFPALFNKGLNMVISGTASLTVFFN
jgi:hypothetical protein